MKCTISVCISNVLKHLCKARMECFKTFTKGLYGTAKGTNVVCMCRDSNTQTSGDEALIGICQTSYRNSLQCTKN